MVIVPFEVELAKKITNNECEGKIITRDGRSVRILCFDRKSEAPIVSLVLVDGNEEGFHPYTLDGRWKHEKEDKFDLMLEIPEYMTFKDGDVIAYDGFDTISITMADVIRNVNDVFAHYYAELRNGKLHFYEEDERDVLNVGARLATESEKQKLIEALKESKEPKAKECLKMLGIEIKPKCEFRPKDWVLCYSDGWNLCQFSHTKLRDIDNKLMYVTVGGIAYEQCIPYNDQTAHLLGTDKDWEEEK